MSDEHRFGEAEVFTMSFSFATAMHYCERGHWADRRAWGDTKRVVADGGTVVYPDGRSGAYSPTKEDRAARDWRVGHWLEKEKR